MRKMILALFIFYSGIMCAQHNCTQDSMAYSIAYDYIMNDSINKGQIIAVSDSIIDLDRYWYSRELDSFPEEKRKLNQYRASKKFIWFTPYYSQCLSSLFCQTKDKSAIKVIFFSQIEDNMLLVDLLPRKKHYNMFRYSEMAFQNEGMTYLFIFSEEGLLKVVISREMHYD